MNRQRFGLLLLVAILVLSGALYLSTQRNRPPEAQGVAVMPELATGFNTVTAVTIRKGSATPSATLHKTGEQWTVAERADYPADVVKLRKLLLALRDAKILEEKTADPARFADIGVEDPSGTASAAAGAAPAAAPGTAAPASGTEVTVTSPAGSHSLIVGKPEGEGNFVRRPGENQSYTVEPEITVETEPRLWIDSSLIDVPAVQIQSLDVKPASGAGYVLHRVQAAAAASHGPNSGSTAGSGSTAAPEAAPPTASSFTLDSVPPGRKALDEHELAPAPTTLAGLTAEDVAPAGSVDFGQASQVAVTLTDGNVLTLIGTVAADKHWLEVKSTQDAGLTAKTEGRAYEIAGYRYDAIFKPVEQLLVPKEPPVKPAAAGGTAPKGGATPKSSTPPKASAVPAHASKKSAPPPAAAP